VTQGVLEEMRRLKDAGLPKKEIVGRLGLSYGTVLNYLEREEGLLAGLRRRLELKPSHRSRHF